jgi:palmitoyltransferase
MYVPCRILFSLGANTVQYVSVTPEPPVSRVPRPRSSYDSVNGNIGGAAYESSSTSPPHAYTNTHSEAVMQEQKPSHISNMSTKSLHISQGHQSANHTADPETGVSDAIPSPSRHLNPEPSRATAKETKENVSGSHSRSHARIPPNIPVLLPHHRYCQRDQILKPPRTHHCRACGTVRFPI